MMRRTGRYVVILVAGLGLAACGVTPQDERGPGLEVEGETTKVRPASETSSAVLALLAQANVAARDGDLAVAEARLERALRIEPRNPVLWYYLAKLRLHQGRLKQAAGLAAKSNSLDRSGNRQLQADNWRIIAHARYRDGDLDGARAADQRATALLNDQ